jgi:hypothetical protein
MGRSHHDQVRPVLSPAAIAAPRLAIGSDRPVFPGNGQTLRDAFDPFSPSPARTAWDAALGWKGQAAMRAFVDRLQNRSSCHAQSREQRSGNNSVF